MGGQGGQTAPPDTKNREGEKKIGKGRRGKGKEKEEKKGRREKKKGRKKEKRRKKGRKREEGREREGKQRKKRKGRGINTVLIEIWRIIMTWILPRSIHQIARIQYKNSKIFQLLRGAHPPYKNPPVRASAHLALTRHWETSPVLPPRTVRAGYAPAYSFTERCKIVIYLLCCQN